MVVLHHMIVCDASYTEHAIKFRIQKDLNFIKIKRIGPQQNIAALQNHKCHWNNIHSMKNDSVQLMKYQFQQQKLKKQNNSKNLKTKEKVLLRLQVFNIATFTNDYAFCAKYL